MRTRYHNNNRLELEKEKTMTLIEAARAVADPVVADPVVADPVVADPAADPVAMPLRRPIRHGASPKAGAGAEAEAVAWMMVNPTTLPGERRLCWEPQTDWHITWEAVPLYAAPQPARNHWKDAIDDELVCLHLGTTETFPEPREALRQIINWHVEIALDPAVSSRAAELQSRGPAQKAEQAQAVWAPIDTAPPGQTVLVHYRNCADNGRTMRATYYSPETLESDTSDSGWADEGWYEESEAYEYLMPLQGEPTHWMPLPPPPDAPQPPQPARKPMTHAQGLERHTAMLRRLGYDVDERTAYLAGIRDAEIFHGITGDEA